MSSDIYKITKPPDQPEIFLKHTQEHSCSLRCDRTYKDWSSNLQHPSICTKDKKDIATGVWKKKVWIKKKPKLKTKKC